MEERWGLVVLLVDRGGREEGASVELGRGGKKVQSPFIREEYTLCRGGLNPGVAECGSRGVLVVVVSNCVVMPVSFSASLAVFRSLLLCRNDISS